jgi:hypothetical protein
MATVKGKRTIYVGPADHGHAGKPLNVEGKALGVVRPGSLLAEAATGLDESAQAAIIFGASRLWADKDQQRTKTVEDDWVINENMVALQARSGEFLNVLVATGQAITKRRTPLSSNGDGTLKIAVTPATVGATSEEILAYSDEIVTTTGVELVAVIIA